MISVVIPTLNEAPIARQRLDALQWLRDAGHELILVDGGSLDATRSIAGSLVDQLVLSQPGRALQLNAGAATARGDILWFLHLDSVIPAHADSSVENAVTDGDGWGRFDVRLSGDAGMFRVIERLMNLRSCVTGICTGDQGVFVRRNLFDGVGGFPEIALMEDIALSKRLKRIGRPRCLQSPIETSSRRWERDGIWRTVLLMSFLRAAYQFGADPAWLVKIYYGSRAQV